MKVGSICKLKVDCLGNKAGTLGVVFNDYEDGFQVIFKNGNQDGFSTLEETARTGTTIEAYYFLEEVGFEISLADYQFQSVLKVSEDYRSGLFNIAWSEGWKKYVAEGWPKKFADIKASVAEPEYEKCEVYADGCKPPCLRFKRKHLEGEGMLSFAMDYVDFSHFEYSDIDRKCMHLRWIQGDITLYPLYVVFKRKEK